jgi:hypothetical protein
MYLSLYPTPLFFISTSTIDTLVPHLFAILLSCQLP